MMGETAVRRARARGFVQAAVVLEEAIADGRWVVDEEAPVERLSVAGEVDAVRDAIFCGREMGGALGLATAAGETQVAVLYPSRTIAYAQVVRALLEANADPNCPAHNNHMCPPQPDRLSLLQGGASTGDGCSAWVWANRITLTRVQRRG